MASYILGAPSEGKALVVVNIFVGLVEHCLNHVARELHKVSALLHCVCGVGLAYSCFSKENISHRGAAKI